MLSWGFDGSSPQSVPRRKVFGDPKKIAKTHQAGFEAMLADATNPEQFNGRVRFTILSHFLEHLPDYETVTRAVKTAVDVSNEFVFIQQPWFDSDGELLRQRLKFSWSDWRGHPMTLTTLQMYRIARQHLAKGAIARATIFGNKPVTDTDHECIVPLSAPMDSLKYDPTAHGPKLSPAAPLQAYKEVFVVLAKHNPKLTDSLLDHFPHVRMLHDEQASG